MNKRKVLDVLWVMAAWSAAALCCAVFSILLYSVFSESPEMSFSFILQNPENAGRAGGIYSVLVSTALIVLTCVVVVVPLSLGTVFFLFNFGHRSKRIAAVVRTCLDVLASTPSIVFGLFGSAFFCLYLKLGFSVLAGGLTLACMVLPAVIRMLEEGVQAVPKRYHHNAAALGFSETAIFFKILMPAAIPTAFAALLLGIARALSETAALLFTSGYVLRTPESLLDSGRALSVHIYDLAMNIPGGDQNAYRSAAILICMLLFINGSSIFLMNCFQKRLMRK